MHIVVRGESETIPMSDCCGGTPVGDTFDRETQIGFCSKCHEMANFELACPQCESTNLNEDNNLCWDCNANDFS